jgi:hypothetical protein
MVVDNHCFGVVEALRRKLMERRRDVVRSARFGLARVGRPVATITPPASPAHLVVEDTALGSGPQDAAIFTPTLVPEYAADPR